MSKCKKHYYEIYVDKYNYFSCDDNFSLFIESDVKLVKWCKESYGYECDKKDLSKAKYQRKVLSRLLADEIDDYYIVWVREYDSKRDMLRDWDIDDDIIKISKVGKVWKVKD